MPPIRVTYPQASACRPSPQVGALELLTERFRPTEEYFNFITRGVARKTFADQETYKSFEELNSVPPLLSFACERDPLARPDKDNGWAAHAQGEFALACASSTAGHNDGLAAFGADNILKNRAFFIRRQDGVYEPHRGVPALKGADGSDTKIPHEDYRPRDGSTAPFVSISNRSARGSDHHIRHEMYATVMSLHVAAEVNESAGTCHCQVGSAPTDQHPTLFLVLPIGCLLEEIILIEGSGGNGEAFDRLRRLTVSAFHLEGFQLRAARHAPQSRHFDVLQHMCQRPVWTGSPDRPSGEYAMSINLRKWAVDKQQQEAQATGRQLRQVGCVFFAGGSQGIARVEDGEGGGIAPGVIANVVRVELRPPADDNGQAAYEAAKLPVDFRLGGLVLVGRRIQDPLENRTRWDMKRRGFRVVKQLSSVTLTGSSP